MMCWYQRHHGATCGGLEGGPGAAEREAGLVLKGENCFFGVEEVGFIGHQVSAEGIQPERWRI
jgi:hypothetical protein